MTPLKLALIFIVIIVFGFMTDDLPTLKSNPKIQNFYQFILGGIVISLFACIIWAIFYYIHI